MKKILVICGPTASGKTDISIKLAEKFSGEIVSCDSMQIYKKLDIGTAKPTKEEQSKAPHHLIDIVEPNTNFSVAKYKELAVNTINEILSRGKLPIIVGGTGLYLDSILNNTQFLDIEPDLEYRNFLEQEEIKNGEGYLKNLLFKIDENEALKLPQNDKKRIIRALEVYKLCGKTQTEINSMSKLTPSEFTPLIFGLNYIDRTKLYDKINLRVDKMINDGLIEEVKSIVDSGLSKTSTALQAIGYKEVLDYLYNGISLDTVIEKIKISSRRYAKRQITWFKRNENIIWKYIDNSENVFNEIVDTITKKW